MVREAGGRTRHRQSAQPEPGLKLRFSDEADAVREALEDEHLDW